MRYPREVCYDYAEGYSISASYSWRASMRCVLGLLGKVKFFDLVLILSTSVVLFKDLKQRGEIIQKVFILIPAISTQEVVLLKIPSPNSNN